ncbi:MAG TPA: large conductance mechanosensitive channel protein MscL [Ruminococcaceae bacterium]|nr:large conductance mechanosensitive channel protein MscL [Oscillospiraceae bacterium]HCB65342.1 large conductance mechanosensitive channel protein MscL [Oscillospiraceae bacterium]
MKKNGFWSEFRQFIAKGNVMNLAVGVIIGAAFQAITNSLVNDIISPVIGLFASADMSAWSVMVGGAEIRYGAFLTAIINFLIMALVIFLLVKILNRIMAMGKKPEPKAEPTTKKCPFCCSEIAIEATRCPHCTSELEK